MIRAFSTLQARVGVPMLVKLGIVPMILLATASTAGAAGELFPKPFVVEHQMVQHDPDGTVLVGETVVDHYVGSQIVSERPDGSRLIIDLERRELTEVHPERGVYTVVGFERLAELQRRLARAERRQVGLVDDSAAEPERGDEARQRKPKGEPRFVIETGSPDTSLLQADATRQAVPEKARTLLQREGVERLIVRLAEPGHGDDASGGSAGSKGTERPVVVEVWIDPRVRLSRAAREALARFERDVLGAGGDGDHVPLNRYIAAARDHGDGALPIRIVRPATGDPARAARSGLVEDIAIRVEPQASVPEELLSIPDDLERRPHVLEGVVAFSEEEAERNLRSLNGAR